MDAPEPAPPSVAALPSDAALPAVTVPDAGSRRAVLDRCGGTAGPLGQLAELAGWLAAVQGTCPPRAPGRVRVLLVAGDHGIAAAGVSLLPAGSTALEVAAVRERSAPIMLLAPDAPATVRVLDVALDIEPAADDRFRVRRSSGRIDREDALTDDEVATALRLGRELADEEVDAGADLLIPGSLGVGATTAASTLVAAMTGAEPVAVVGRGSGIDDDGWMRKTAAVRDALRRTRPHRRSPQALLRTAGGADLAVLTGLLVQAALRRTPVLIDGLVVGAAALLAEALAPGARAWWLAAQRSPEPAMTRVLDRLDLTPVLDLRLRLGDGSGALAVVPMLRMGARLLAGSGASSGVGLTKSRG